MTDGIACQDPQCLRLTIDDLALLFLEHAESYYRHADGTSTGTADHFRMALRPLVRRRSRMPIDDIGPRALASPQHPARLTFYRPSLTLRTATGLTFPANRSI